MDLEKRRDIHTDRETIRASIHALTRHRRLFIMSLLYLVSKVLINVILPLLISLTFASMVTGTDPDRYIAWLVVVATVGTLTNYFGIKAVVTLNAIGQYELNRQTFDTLLRRSVGFHANSIAGKLVSNAMDYASAHGRLVDAAYVNLIPLAVTFVVGIVVVAASSLPLALALLIVIGTILALSVIEGQQRKNLRFERRRVQNRLVAHYSDTIVNANAVKTFAREHDEAVTNGGIGKKLLEHRIRDWVRSIKSGTMRIGVLLVLQIGLIAFITHLYSQDSGVLGVGIFAFVYTITLINRLFDITTLILTIEEALLDASTMTRILMEDFEITDKPNAPDLAVRNGAISLKNISFSYPDSNANDTVFECLSLDIEPGQKVGIVGPSGGGKSTLTRLLLRFEDVTAGSITIDEQDIRDVTQASLRSQIAYVPQEPLLFHRSIFENIAYGKPNATLNEAKQAAKLAYADDFIEQLPHGYDTIVGERGVKLSGGQRQRIAIARAILKDAPILILDEATSALDSESEVYIQKALAQLMKGRTTIVIAHRLSTIQKMDRIIVLADGKIKEDGGHKDLLKANRLYAKLWAHQSGGFIEE